MTWFNWVTHMALLDISTRQSSLTLSGLFSTLESPFLPDVLPNTSKPNQAVQEIELRFLVPTKLGYEIRANREPALIEQSVLPKAMTQQLIRQLGVDRAIEDHDAFTSAQIRRIVTVERESFLLEFKSPKEGRISRLEHSVVIDQELFTHLKTEHSIGSLIKLRYDLPGLLYTPDGVERVGVAMDEIIAAGKPISHMIQPLFSVDIEVSDLSLIPLIRAGRHSLPWLKHCTELNSEKRKHRKALSNRSVAKQGLTEKKLTIFEHLLKN